MLIPEVTFPGNSRYDHYEQKVGLETLTQKMLDLRLNSLSE